MLGDVCPSCSCSLDACTCDETVNPCVPACSDECEDWVSLYCTFWMGDPIAGTPIKKGTRGTEIITHLLSRISELEARVYALENP